MEKFEEALVYDFRSKFNISLYDVGYTIKYREAYNLCVGLLSFPESLYFTKYHLFKLPVSQTEILLIEMHNRIVDDVFTNVDKKHQNKKKDFYIKQQQPEVPVIRLNRKDGDAMRQRIIENYLKQKEANA